MSNELKVWDAVLASALKLPLVRVNREEFLRKELSIFCSKEQDLDKVVSSRPIDVLSRKQIDMVAESCIKNHTRLVTATSFVAGIPGGLALVGTIPADTAQYFGHVLALAQKLVYLYGFPNIEDENGNITDTSKDLLTVFVGVMLGATAANAAIAEIAKRLSGEVAKRLPRIALTKTTIYPLIKQVAKWIGVSLTKSSFAKGVSKLIPILGGVISGGVTYATFHPQAKRLQSKLQELMEEMPAPTTESSDDKVGEYTEFTEA